MGAVTRRIPLILAGALVLAACGGAEAGSPGTEAAPVVTERPTTTRRPTTTEAPTTTAAPTTTEALPVPLPPPEPRAPEPIIQIGSIQIPKLGIDKPMFEGVSLTVLDHGPGHWPGTAMPGHLGNSVIAGHRTSHDKPFRHVDQLVPGDEVILNTLEGPFVYEVVETTIVTPDSLFIIDQTREYRATLFACHPVGSTRERIVVHLRLKDESTAITPPTD